MDSIEYKGNSYPVREFEVEELPYVIVVAPLSLYLALEEDVYEDIDDRITFYLEDVLFSLPSNAICREHLDEPFTLIQEL